MNGEELKPCPFCGGTKMTLFRGGLKCNTCLTRVVGNGSHIEAWNRRAALVDQGEASADQERESAWLIERGDLGPTPHYFARRPGNRHAWTGDANQAERFADRASAEAETNGDPTLTVAEHVFCRLPDQGEASLCEGKEGVGLPELPCAETGPCPSSPDNLRSDGDGDIQADLDLLGGLVLHLEDDHPLTIGKPVVLARALRRVLSLAYPDQPSDGEGA